MFAVHITGGNRRNLIWGEGCRALREIELYRGEDAFGFLPLWYLYYSTLF